MDFSTVHCYPRQSDQLSRFEQYNSATNSFCKQIDVRKAKSKTMLTGNLGSIIAGLLIAILIHSLDPLPCEISFLIQSPISQLRCISAKNSAPGPSAKSGITAAV